MKFGLFFKVFQPNVVFQGLMDDPKFQQQLSEEVNRSGRLRSLIMVSALLIIFIPFLVTGVTGKLPLELYQPLWGLDSYFWIMILIWGMVFTELTLWAILRWKPLGQFGLWGFRIGPYFIAFIEVSALTMSMVIQSQVINPLYVLTAPPMILYGTVAMFLILFQNGWVCFFAGVVASLEYLSIAMIFILPLESDHTFLSNFAQHFMKSILILVGGGMAAFVAWEIKKRMMNSFNDQYLSQQELLKNKQTALEQQQELTLAYQRFVPNKLLDLLEKNSILDVQLGDQVQKEMTVLFSDIRSFTTLSEGMTPKESFQFINNYLSQMGPIVQTYHGFIDKYIGDAIMALFDTNADDAIQASIAMLQLLQTYNPSQVQVGKAPVKIGIGINTGMLMLGTVGEENRMEGTVISDAVNLASRIEGMTKVYGASLLISENTFQRLSEASNYSIRVIGRVIAKGTAKPVLIYEVMDGDLPEILDNKRRMMKTYDEALQFYNHQQLDDAIKLFQECIKQHPDDLVPQVYLQRCHQILNGQQEWDGVSRLETK